MSLSSIRRDYRGTPLSESEASADPFALFAAWYAEAQPLERDPTAMILATATQDGRPSARVVLLKDADERGFVFYTNYRSRKAKEIGETHRASLLFYWSSLERQVRVEGTVAAVSEAESDAYFASRPVDSRLSVHASAQSTPVESRDELERAVNAARDHYGDAVPRPAWWGGYRVTPDAFEFWQGRPNRLHDRLRYLRQGDAWRRDRLAP